MTRLEEAAWRLSNAAELHRRAADLYPAKARGHLLDAAKADAEAALLRAIDSGHVPDASCESWERATYRAALALADTLLPERVDSESRELTGHIGSQAEGRTDEETK